MTRRPKRLEQTTNSGLAGLTSLMSKDWKFGEIDGATERLNPTLEHLEQLNDCRFQLSATETTTYVRFNLLCKQGVAGSNPVTSARIESEKRYCP
jgi:hypothetical protein